MKTYCKMVLAFTIILLLSNVRLFGLVDWKNLTSRPCYDTDSNWSGPYVKEFCSNNIPGNPCPGCCFKVIYYERLGYVSGTGKYRYFTAITGIFHSEGENCDTCSRYSVIDYFYNILLADKANDQGFMDSVQLSQNGNVDIAMTILFTKGMCFDYNSVECEKDIERCCETRYNVYFDEYHELSDIDSLTEFPPDPSCPNDCYGHCKQVMYNSLNDTLCVDLLCNKGQWENTSTGFKSLSMFGCPQCSVNVYYQRRNSNCNPPFKDIRIKKIEYSNDTLCLLNCPNFSYPNIYWYFVKYIVKAEGSQNLGVGNCDTNYRVLHYSCWEQNSYTKSYDPCTSNGCCWGRYIICRTANDTTLQKIDSSNAENNCSQAAVPCEYICDEPGMPRISIENNESKNKNIHYFSLKPNPTNGFINCTMLLSEPATYVLKFYNDLGAVIYERNINYNKGYINFDIDLSSFSDGLYFYNLLKNDVSIGYGMLNLFK